jgi:hypothetical protein
MPRRYCYRCGYHLSAGTPKLLSTKYKAHMRTCPNGSATTPAETPHRTSTLSDKTLAILRRVDAQRAALATHEKRQESAKRAARRREDRAQRERREQKRMPKKLKVTKRRIGGQRGERKASPRRRRGRS